MPTPKIGIILYEAGVYLQKPWPWLDADPMALKLNIKASAQIIAVGSLLMPT
jgi:hypothetical protein